MSAVGFLAEEAPDADAQRLFDEDVAEDGYVMNVTRLWAYQPTTLTHLFDLMGETYANDHLSFRQRGILVTACASTLGDAYCSIAWGTKLANKSDAETAASVLTGDDALLTPAEQAMAQWARKVAHDPNHTSPRRCAGTARLRLQRPGDLRDDAHTSRSALPSRRSMTRSVHGPTRHSGRARPGRCSQR